MSKVLNEGWKLKSLRIDFQTWGDYTGKYVGKIEFNNKENEAFMFNLLPEETAEYMDLVSKKLVSAASHLGDKLLASLGLLPGPKIVAIEERIEDVPITEPIPEAPVTFPDDLPF